MPSADVRFRKSSWASGSQSSEASRLKLAWTTADAAAASAGVRERMVYFIRESALFGEEMVSIFFRYARSAFRFGADVQSNPTSREKPSSVAGNSKRSAPKRNTSSGILMLTT